MKRRDFLKCGLAAAIVPVVLVTAKYASERELVEMASVDLKVDISFDEFIDQKLDDISAALGVPKRMLLARPTSYT